LEDSTPSGASTCSNYGGECPNPIGSSYTISGEDLTINITQDTGIFCSNTSNITIVPSGGFSATIDLQVTDWDNLIYDSFTLNPSSIPSPYDQTADFQVCVDASVVPSIYNVVITGNGSGVERTKTVRVNVNKVEPSWKEI